MHGERESERRGPAAEWRERGALNEHAHSAVFSLDLTFFSQPWSTQLSIQPPVVVYLAH